LKHLDWDDFRLFVAVARIGSFTRAARELQISEPTVSRRMKRLESTLGAKLFDRGRGASQLSSEGKRVLNYATAAEHSLSRAATLTQEATRQIAGDCNIIMGDGLGSYWMPPFLASFFELHPAIGLRLFTTQEIGNDQTPPFDIQVCYSHPLTADRVAIRVATLHFVLFVAPQYAERLGVPKSVEDLCHHRIADSTSGLATRGSMMSWASIDQNVTFTTNSNVLLGEALRKGGVLGFVPTYTSALFPDLRPVLPEVRIESPVFLCFERETGAKPAVRATIDYLKNYVFDRQRMPWFSDQFVMPRKNWKKIFAGCLARASAGHGK